MRVAISRSYSVTVTGKFQNWLSTYGRDQQGCWCTISE